MHPAVALLIIFIPSVVIWDIRRPERLHWVHLDQCVVLGLAIRKRGRPCCVWQVGLEQGLHFRGDGVGELDVDDDEQVADKQRV